MPRQPAVRRVLICSRNPTARRTSPAVSACPGSCEIPTDPELTFDVQNLFNSKLRAYDQWVTATHNYYDQGQVIMFGVRGTW